MANYEISDPSGAKYQVTAPDDASQADVLKYAQANFSKLGQSQPVNPISDFAQSIPRGVLSGLIGATSGPPVPDSPYPIQPELLQGAGPAMQAAEGMTGPLYRPQGRAGQFGAAMGETLGNPLSYVGPGGLPLKIGGAALAGLGGEGGRQLGEGTALETPLSLAGSLAGGLGAVKAFGADIPKAAIPVEAELRADKTARYKGAANSDIELSGNGFGLEASKWKQELTQGPEHAFTSEPGDAPRTLAILDRLSAMPADAVVTAPNLQTIGKQINNITKETKDFKPTPDAAAAMALKERFNAYLENPYPTDVLGGNAQSYASRIQAANQANTAYRNTQRVNQGIDIAQGNYEGNIASRLDNQLKSQVTKPLIKDIARGRAGSLSPEQQDLVKEANRGDIITRTAAELGRGHSVPMIGANLLYALATGGAHIPLQVVAAAGAYGSRKLAESRTLANIQKLADAMAKRSPLYQERLKGLPVMDNSANKAALIRAILGMH